VSYLAVNTSIVGAIKEQPASLPKESKADFLPNSLNASPAKDLIESLCEHVIRGILAGGKIVTNEYMLGNNFQEAEPWSKQENNNGHLMSEIKFDAALEDKKLLGNNRMGQLDKNLDNNRMGLDNNKMALDNNKMALDNNKMSLDNNKMALDNNKMALDNNKMALDNNRMGLSDKQMKEKIEVFINDKANKAMGQLDKSLGNSEIGLSDKQMKDKIGVFVNDKANIGMGQTDKNNSGSEIYNTVKDGMFPQPTPTQKHLSDIGMGQLDKNLVNNEIGLSDKQMKDKIGVFVNDKANIGMGLMDKINAGREIYNTVKDGMFPQPTPTQKELSDLTWYLHALAGSKAGALQGQKDLNIFRAGTLTIEDPHGSLGAYLNSADSYKVPSNNLKEFQKWPEGQLRGVDIRNNPAPWDCRTILFQEQESKGVEDRKMLSVKFESHGCRGLSLKGPGPDPATQSVFGRFKSAVGRFLRNVSDFIGHAFNFLGSVGRKLGILLQPSNTNNERLGTQLRERCEGMSRANNNAKIDGILDSIKTNPKVSKGEIKGIFQAIDKAIADFDELERGLSSEQKLGAISCKDDLNYFRESELKKFDHPEFRFDQEIILLSNDPVLGKVGGDYDLTYKPSELSFT
jgi:predicted DNA-binding transcriptional regulator AlpA